MALIFFLTILIFLFLLFFVIPRLLYFLTLIYYMLFKEKNTKKRSYKHYSLKDLGEVRSELFQEKQRKRRKVK